MNIKDYEIFKSNHYSEFINNGKTYLINQEPYLDVVLTDKCNANCSFCIADLIHNKLNINFEVLKEKILFAVNNMQVKEVLLLGGEPTVSNLLLPTIKFLTTLNLNKIIITTNGINIAKNDTYRESILSSGITHLNISFMSNCNAHQKDIVNSNYILSINDLKIIKECADKYNVKIRINNNIFKGNNDTIYDILDFYEKIKDYCHSIKFSPLLKVDAFSVIDIKTKWVNEHILTDEEYDNLFDSVIRYFNYKGVQEIVNDEQFGFVKNVLLPFTTPIIFNYNQHGQMMNKVINENKINNLKILPNGELSLSWNRELTEYFIKTN